MSDETLDLLIETVRDEATGLPSDDLVHDNLRYLRELKALREAAGKVTDTYDNIWSTYEALGEHHKAVNALRSLLSPAPSTPRDSTPATP